MMILRLIYLIVTAELVASQRARLVRSVFSALQMRGTITNFGRCCRFKCQPGCEMTHIYALLRTDCGDMPIYTGRHENWVIVNERRTCSLLNGRGFDSCVRMSVASYEYYTRALIDEFNPNCQHWYNKRPHVVEDYRGMHGRVFYNAAAVAACGSFYGLNCKTIRTDMKTFLYDPYTGVRTCFNHLFGDRCTETVPQCQPNACLNGGSCTIVGAGHVCNCPPLFIGSRCEIHRCNSVTCEHGVCADDLRCICKVGFTGNTCSEPNCDDYCFNGGLCGIDPATREKVCTCQSSTVGERCEHTCLGGCANGGLCSLRDNSPVCNCLGTGFTGPTCSVPENTQNICDQKLCQNGANCTVVEGNVFVCTCKPGWTGSYCERSICYSNTCNNGMCLIGIDACVCLPGYSGDDCSVVTCDNYGLCKNGGTCSVTSGVHQCQCNDKTHTGRYCELGCARPCVNGKCVQRNGVVGCKCNAGFEGDDCSIAVGAKDVCKPNPCQNGGRCTIDNAVAKCKCPKQYTGSRCEIPVCNRKNCVFGSCLDGVGCQCYSNVRGDNCDVTSCPPGYCSNGATCKAYSLVPKCNCDRSKYTGTQCEFECTAACSEGGNCELVDGRAKCVCEPGFYGESCSQRNEFFFQVQSQRYMMIASVIVGLLIVGGIVGIVMKRRKVQRIALKNAMYDPSDALNLPSADTQPLVGGTYNLS